MIKRLLLTSVAVLVAASCGARSSLDLDPVGLGAGAEEICNGVDDDGDGDIDEGLGQISCGIGVCLTVVSACQDGLEVACEPGPAATEVCNGLDDDCDGATDEGLGFGPIRGPFTVAFGPYFGANVIAAMGDGLLLGTTHATDPIGASESAVYALAIDLDGQALGPEQQVLVDAFWGPAISSAGGEHAIFASCWSTSGESRATSRTVGADGAAVAAPIVRSPSNRSCGAGYPAVHETGSHQLFAWIDNSSGPVEGHEVLLDVADGSGTSVGARELHPDGDLVNGSPSFAQNADRVALSFGVRQDGAPSTARLWLGLLDLAGKSLGEPRILEGEHATVSFGEPRLVARAAGGFVLLAGDRFSAGLYQATFEADLAGPQVVASVPAFDDRVVSSLSAKARLGGGAVIAAAAHAAEDYVGRGFVASLDDDGAITHLWESSQPDELDLHGAAVAMVGHRVFVAYRVIDEDTEIRLREFGCTP